MAKCFRSILLAVALVAVVKTAAATAHTPNPATKSLAMNAATPGPRFSPSTNIEYVDLFPTRPRDAGMIRIAIGTFQSFDAGGLPPIMTLTLRDDDTGVITRYMLSAGTTLNGRALCESKTGFCSILPASVVAGRTHLAVLYWQPAFPQFPSYRGTDTLLIVPISKP
jgi:hypothetical protein